MFAIIYMYVRYEAERKAFEEERSSWQQELSVARQELLEQNDRLTLLSQQLAGTKASLTNMYIHGIIMCIYMYKPKKNLVKPSHKQPIHTCTCIICIFTEKKSWTLDVHP